MTLHACLVRIRASRWSLRGALAALLVVGAAATSVSCVGARVDLDPQFYGDPGSDAAQRRLAADMADFAFAMHRSLLATSPHANIVTAPQAVAGPLTALYSGAIGPSRLHFERALSLRQGGSALHETMGALHRRASGTAGADLHGMIWHPADVPLNEGSANLIQERYGIPVAPQDCRGSAARCRQAINDWIQEHTDGVVRDLFSGRTPRRSTSLLLTTSGALDATWSQPFRVLGTFDQSFAVPGTSGVPVPTMRQMSNQLNGTVDGHRFVDLGLADGRFAATFVLPATTLEALEAELTGSLYTRILRALAAGPVDVKLPRVTINQQHYLTEPLRSLGLTLPLREGRADLSGLGGDIRQLWLTDVLQHAALRVDEHGVSSNGPSNGGGTTDFIELDDRTTMTEYVFDRPFLVIVRHVETSSIVLLARVVDPR